MMRANNNDSQQMHRTLRARLWRDLALALLPLAVCWAPMGAAADDSQPPATTAETGQLQEVVVTAQRREENLSKVPISVTALTQEDMDTKGIKDITDVGSALPLLGGDGMRYDPLPEELVSRRRHLGFVYLDGAQVVLLGFAEARTLAAL